MSNGGSCTLEEQYLFNSSHGTSMVCLTRGDTIGLTLVAESGFISLVSVLGAFILIFCKAIRSGTLIRLPTDVYMFSLFSFDLIAALGTVIYIKWIHDGKVYTGEFCTAEGIVVQLGLTGSALATLAIAIHTFVVVMWGPYRRPYFVAYTTVGLTWFFLVSFIAISVSVHTHGSDFYYTPVGYWCWIGNHYRAEQFTGQYIWIWIAMFVSFLTYVPLFFWARGNITVSPTHWWKFRVHRGNNIGQDIDPDGRKRRSIRMIVYPIVFAMVALPYSVVRWKTHFGDAAHRLPTATFGVYVLFGLSGTFNVLLFLFTRPSLLLPRNIDLENCSVGQETSGLASTTGGST